MTRLQASFRGVTAAAALFVAAFAGCSGGGDGDQTPRVEYGKMVSFGDSLSDVGTYRVSGIAALGGGEYTINGPDNRIWIERLAAQLGLSAPCAAQTGLNATEALIGFPPAPVVDHPGCFDYAQGGARVTNPVGPGNAALLALGDPSGALGQLTDPIADQIERHLAITGGSFEADDLVTVLGGGNDVFLNLAGVSAAAAGGGDVAAASAAAVTAMATAGAELSGYIRDRIVARGATRVVVVNLPDISLTPFALALDEGTRSLVLTMCETFNGALSAGLEGVDGVLVVDAFTESQRQVADPDQYALDNVTDLACDLDETPIGSLTCTADTLIEGDTSHYEYADTVHPTPYGYQLLAQFVALHMGVVGWL